MKKQFAALLAALSLLPTLALAQEYYALPEIREQAKDGWHETYTDRYGREIQVDIDADVFGEQTAPLIKAGFPQHDIYYADKNCPYNTVSNVKRKGGRRTHIYRSYGSKVDLDRQYGTDYGNDLTLNEMYAYMKKLFVSKNAGCLIQQELDRYFIRTIDDVMPKVTGSEEIYNIKYLLPYKDKGKKIVLYGAGRIGKDFYKQVINAGMTCYWTDSNWEKIDNSCIISVEEALKKEFDKIVIAIKNEKIVQNVCNELKNKGVPESKIIWDIQTIYD